MGIRLERDFVPGTHKVVSADEVEYLTSVGWRIIRVMESSAPISYCAKNAELGGQHNNWINTPAQMLQQVGTVPMFLMAQSRDAEMMSLREQLQKSQEAEEAARHSAKSITWSHGELQKECSAATVARDQHWSSLTESREQLARSRESVSKMEADLGKLRSALGELRMKEILGPK